MVHSHTPLGSLALLFSSCLTERSSPVISHALACLCRPAHPLTAGCVFSLQDQGAGSTDLDLAESLESTPKQQEHSAGAKAVEQPSVADLISSELETAAPEGLPAPKISAQASEAAGSSRSSSQSPQLSLQLQTGMSQEQQGQDLPSWAAPAAQVVGPAPMSGQQQSGAAPDEVPWQEVRASRRKPASQHAAPKASARQAAKHGRGAHHQENSSPSQSCLEQLTAPAQHVIGAPRGPEKAPGPPQAQSMHAAVEHSPYPWPVSAGSASQQLHHGGHSVPQHAWSQAFPFSVQQKPVQATTAGTMTNKAHAAHQPAQVLLPGLTSAKIPLSLTVVYMLPYIVSSHRHFALHTSQKSLSVVTCNV